MDITKPITYRGLNVNSVVSAAGSRILRGIAVEGADYSEVPAVGYTEKRAASDGMHASDVYLGARRVSLNGHIYAATTAEFFDYLHVLRAVFSPTSAYTESPGDRGFLPMEFQQPTEDTVSFVGGIVNLMMLVRPLDGSPRFNIRRDSLQSADPSRPTATEWSARLFAKDPRVYITPEIIIPINGAPAAHPNTLAKNRGDYEAPLNILINVVTAPAANAKLTIKGFGVDMDILVPATANRVYRWFGDDRVLMEQDTTGGPDAPFVLRMDLVKWRTKNHKPMVPAHINPPSKPFTSTFNWTWTNTSGSSLAASSRIFWNEAFA